MSLWHGDGFRLIISKSRRLGAGVHFYLAFNPLKCFPGGASDTNPPANAGDVSSASSVQLLSRVQLFETSWTAACQASLSITNSRSLLKFMAIKSVSIKSNFIVGL